MSSDNQPLTPSSIPPSYTESQMQYVHSQEPTQSSNAPPSQPPPYSANPNQSVVVDSSGYQTFDFSQGQSKLVSIFHLGPEPCLIICPACGQQVLTITHPTPGTLTWLMACLCFFFCILCTFLPFCVQELQDVAHECPLCRREVGIYSRI